MTARKEDTSAFSLETLSEAVNYNRFVVERMRPYLGNSILELGTGIGNLTPLFLEDQRKVTAIDVERALIKVHRQRVKSAPRLKVECISLPKLARRKGERGKYDAVVSSNVLEHIPDGEVEDVAGAMFTVLKKGGHAVHWVPAFKSIYGSMDKTFGHFRRYDRYSGRELFERAGFRIRSCSYWNMAGFFGWWFTGRVMKRTSIPRTSALTFDRFVVPVMRSLEPLVWRPFGQSLLIVAEKPK